MRKSRLIKHYNKLRKIPKELYHISECNLDGRRLRPRIPSSVLEGDEDATIARVCFSSSMSGCYRAIEFSGGCPEEFYVHRLANKEELLNNKELLVPTTELVPDQEYTNEYWSIGMCELQCIGKARFVYYPLKSFFNKRFRDRVYIKWIEKY